MMLIFTITNGQIELGAQVERIKLSGADLNIAAIVVGEEGRGRRRDILPAPLRPEDCPARIERASVGTTRSGRPRLITEQSGDTHDCIIVFRTKGGFRGGASHTGDREAPDNPKAFLPFPGRILARGMIADGMAGRMGGNEQIIAVMPRGAWFRTGYTGRLYGAPSEHYYRFDGKQLIAVTWEERQVLELAEEVA